MSHSQLAHIKQLPSSHIKQLLSFEHCSICEPCSATRVLRCPIFSAANGLCLPPLFTDASVPANIAKTSRLARSGVNCWALWLRFSQSTYVSPPGVKLVWLFYSFCLGGTRAIKPLLSISVPPSSFSVFPAPVVQKNQRFKAFLSCLSDVGHLLYLVFPHSLLWQTRCV